MKENVIIMITVYIHCAKHQRRQYRFSLIGFIMFTKSKHNIRKDDSVYGMWLKRKRNKEDEEAMPKGGKPKTIDS